MHHPPRLVRVAALTLAATVVLAGCSPQDGGGDGEPTTGGDLVYAVANGPTNFDPNVTASAPDAIAIRQIYDSLVDLRDGEVVPWLATSWEVADDGREYTFTLRDDVTFHDGTPFDAEAVCFNFDRIVDPAVGSLYAVALIGAYESCEAPDATTAVIRLASPYTPFLANLSTPFLGMVSPTAAAAAEPAEFAVNPVGTGPFRFVSFAVDSELRLERFEDYDWAPAGSEHEGPALLDTLTFQVIGDATVRSGSLTSGDVDVIDNVPAQQVATIESDPTLEYRNEVQGGATFQIFLNTSRPAFSDPAVRVAIAQAMDVDAAVTANYFGAYGRATSPLAPSTAGFDDETAPIAFDAEAAAAALDDAGWTVGADGVRERDGERLSLTYLEFSPSYDGRLELAEFLKANLEEIGVEVEIAGGTGAQLAEAIAADGYDFVTTSFIAVDPDILNTLYQSGSYFNFARVDAYDDRLAEGRAAEPGPERDAVYAELQREIVDEAVSIPVYLMAYRVATSARVGGLAFDAAAYPELYAAYLGAE